MGTRNLIILLSKSEREYHRKTAARCFNETWEYLEKKRRTREEDLKMLQSAHASRYHWGIVGTPRNRAVGEWQISRVYAALKQPRLSLLFAMSSLDACRRENLTEILVPAYEGLARAHAVARERSLARKYLKLAQKLLRTLDLESEDKRIYLGQIEDTAKMIH